MNSDDIRAVNWLDIIEALGLTPDRHQLPAALNCPLCQKGTVHVYHDPAAMTWLHCGRCAFSGDPITFASAVWQTADHETITRLIVERKLKTTEDFVKTYADARNVLRPFERLWRASEIDYESASRFMPTTRSKIPVSWQRQVRLMQRAVLSHTHYRSSRHYDVIPKSWKEFAVMPLEIMPGQQVGALAIRDGKLKILCDADKRETMLFGLGPASAAASKFLLIMDDVEQAFQLQVRMLNEFFRPAPVCGMYNRGQYAPIWRQMRQQLIFWGKEITQSLFREAASCQGECIIRSRLPNNTSVAAQLNGLAPLARPWHAVLNQHLLTLLKANRHDEIRNFVLGIGLKTSELHTLVANAPEALEPFLAPMVSNTGDTITYNGYEVSRHGDELFACRIGATGHRPVAEKQIRISDTVLLIHRINDGENATYSGEILRHGKTYYFETPLAELEENPDLWLRRQCWKRNLKEPCVHPSWKSHLASLARQFGDRVYFAPTATPGWSFELDSLVASDWRLGRQGVVENWANPRLEPPGQLNMPLPLTETAIGAMSRMAGASAFWPVLAQVAASLLSPLTGHRPRDLLLMGRAARELGVVTAKLSGCSVIGTATLPASLRLLQQLQASAQARWPVVLLTDHNHSRLPDVLSGNQTLSAIYRPHNDIRALELLITKDCNLLDVGPTVGDPDAIQNFGGDILPAYLLDLSRRDFKLFPKDDITAAVLSDMSYWWHSLGGTASMHCRFFHGKARARQALHKLLFACRAAIYNMPLGFGDFLDPHRIPIETDYRFVYFAPARLQSAMAWRAQLDMVRFGRDLKTAELLLGQPEDPVWTFPVSIWDAVVRAVRQRNHT